MANFLTELAIADRNARAKLTALALLGIFIWIIYREFTQPDLISTNEVIGEVVAVNVPSSAKAKNQIVMINVRVDENVFRTMVVRGPYPKVGDNVPVIVETYSDNTKWLGLNVEKYEQGRIGY